MVAVKAIKRRRFMDYLQDNQKSINNVEEIGRMLKVFFYSLSTIYYLLPTILIALLPAISTAEKAIQIPDVVAVVNGTNITKQDIERRMAQSRSMNPERFDAMGLEERKKAIIRTTDNMVMREVIYQEAVTRGIVVTDKEVEMGLDDLKRRFPSEEAFQEAFADANITIPAWKEETRKNMMGVKLEELMAAKLKISDWKRGLLTNATVWKWSP